MYTIQYTPTIENNKIEFVYNICYQNSWMLIKYELQSTQPDFGTSKIEHTI